MTIRHKSYPVASLKTLNPATGTFEALVSVFGNVDLQGERVIPGAFAKSLESWQTSGDPIPVIWSHLWDDPFAHIGKVIAAREAPDGLVVTGQLDMGKPFAKQVYDLMAERRVKEFSFGYDVADYERKSDAIDLTRLDLIEVGPTLKGANQATQLLGVKAMVREMEAKKAIASHSTSTSDGAWDGPANEANLSNDAGASTYRKAFAWSDPSGDADKKSSYKFIHHEVSNDGSVGAANLKACSTGIGVLNGGRGGTTIPADDKQGVYDHLAKHIRDSGADAPELKGRVPGRKAYITLDGSYEDLRSEVSEAVDEWALTRFGPNVYAGVEATFPDHVIVVVYSTWDSDGDYYQIPYTVTGDPDPGDVTLGDPVEVDLEASVVPIAKSAILRRLKEGRRNSMTDQERIQAAHDLMNELGATCNTSEPKRQVRGAPKAKDEALRDPLLVELELLALDT